MLQRFLPIELVKAHWTSIEDRTAGNSAPARPDRPVHVVLILVPTVAAIAAGLTGLEVKAPAAILSALSLFSAGLLAAFAQIASIRSRYRVPDSAYDPDRPVRDMLDEAVAQVLMAALVSVTTALVVVIGMNVPGGSEKGLVTWASCIVTFLGTYLTLLFLMVIRKLWGAYQVANELDHTRI